MSDATAPGPPRNALAQLREIRRARRDPLRAMREEFERRGDVFRVEDRPLGTHHLRHPDHLHRVLVSEAARFRKASEIVPFFLGDGLVGSEGEAWRRQRARLSPGLGRAALAAHAPAIVAATEERIGGWRDGDRVDVGREMMALTLRIVCECLLGVRLRDEVERIEAAARVIHARGSLAGVIDELPEAIASELRWARDEVLSVVDGIIARRRRLGPGADVLSTLLACGDDLPLRDEVTTLLLAGHETASHALTWTWHELGRAPEVEARLRAELAGGADRMAYLRQILAECLRLYPSIFAVSRIAREPVRLGDHEVPAGGRLVCWIYHAHRDARWFPDPDRFDPGRFAPGVEVPRRAYLPFGAGPRRCIGGGFAQLELELVVSTVAARVRLEPDGSAPACPRPRMTLTPERAVPMIVRRP